MLGLSYKFPIIKVVIINYNQKMIPSRMLTDRTIEKLLVGDFHHYILD